MEVMIDNFKQFLHKEVNVEITYYWGGYIYPERNILIGMNKGTFYFKSIEDEPQYWHMEILPEGRDNVSCKVYEKD